MAVIRFVEKVVEFQTDLGVLARAWRCYVVLEFTDGAGNNFRYQCMVDSGAPFSVVPFSLWHDQNLAWQLLGSHFFSAGQPDVAALTWQGVPCQFGETRVRLLDEQAGVRSAPLSLRGKFPVALIPSPVEQEAILGNDFVIENFLSQAMRGSEDRLDGVYLVD
jgi:hypothetical protein